jgi:ABC-type glutathione transport system ATPase component
MTFPPSGSATKNSVLSKLSFDIREGEILGIVGDSGSGKTVAALAVAGLLPENAQITGGRIMFQGIDLLTLSPNERRQLLGSKIGMIFQEPLSSLNPLMTIGNHLTEVITAHNNTDHARLGKIEGKAKIIEMLANIGFHNPERIYHSFPHQLSGGQRQRALIAGALLLKPALLIADEPTTSLDTVTQAQILDQLRRISLRFNLSVLFISHDLMLLERLCDRIAVLHNRRIIECDSPHEILHAPKHSYTATLLRNASFSVKSQNSPPNSIVKPDVIPLLRIEKVSAGYGGSLLNTKYEEIGVLSDVSLKILPGEIMGLVGSSGCGKTTLARVITGLLPGTSGQIYENEVLSADFSKGKRRGKASAGLVFQDPYNSLNPNRTIEWLLEEPLRVNHLNSRAERKLKVLNMMDDVGMPRRYLGYYPHQLSGGQRQRIALGMSLMLSPSLIVADEPVSALDVSVQTQILKLIWDINQKKGIAFLFISHDLRVIRSICDRLAVMDEGEIVETGMISDVFRFPKSPVTQKLIAAEKTGRPSRNE